LHYDRRSGASCFFPEVWVGLAPLRKTGSFIGFAVQLTDLLAFAIAGAWAYYWRFDESIANAPEIIIQLVVAASFMMLLTSTMVYRAWRGGQLPAMLGRVALAWVITWGCVMTWLVLSRSSESFSRIWLGYWGINSLLFVWLGRIVNISKSGTTTEPALAFRILKKQLEDAVGKEEAKTRIVAITDKAKGALRTLATKEGYKTFIIPDNVGGRFSVLTPVGLLPIAVAGISIRELVAGAVSMEKKTGIEVPFDENLSAIYASVRNELYKSGKSIEILANFHPKLHYIGEWWKQLYGESEGKENKGIFPAAVDLTTDLHSMGQWIQEGERTIFETVISVESPDHKVEVPTDEADLDGLNFLAGKRVDEVNKMAELGTQLAHVDGGVPNIKITLPAVNAYYIGQLFYFFEKACGISGYMLGVNPFDQPGVEAYKKNMFALLNKPGYEKESEAIKAKL
jgi:hypothetical protein